MKIRYYYYILLVFVIHISSFSSILASDYIGEVIRNSNKNKRISKLYIPHTIELKNIKKGAKLVTIAVLAARYEQEDSNLFVNNKWIKRSIDKNKIFTFEIPVFDILSSFKIHAVSPTGKVVVETVLIEVPRWKNIMKKERQNIKKRAYFVTSLGYSTYSYKETNIDQSNLTFTNLRFDYQSPFWNISTTARYSIYPIGSNNSDKKLRFIDIDLRSGYTLPFVPFPWKFSLLAGVFYSNMIDNKKTIGYKDLIGMEFYPTVQKIYRKGHIASLYCKISADKRGAGFTWYHMLRNHHPVVLMFDYERIDAKYNTIRIDSDVYHLNIGYGF